MSECGDAKQWSAGREKREGTAAEATVKGARGEGDLEGSRKQRAGVFLKHGKSWGSQTGGCQLTMDHIWARYGTLSSLAVNGIGRDCNDFAA